ncbi:unnamed protein product [Heligmosomoides polygyrus]|uniref:Secreted protein n=1 Tax=Heligmosomoides polygyrus TaxID=6339 RepID=A0A183G4H5_HELPZ|nr:unnamed protein product [Heligmosomoides polygyrus]
MKSFAVLCAFALLGICLALGPKCRGKDPKMFEGLSKMEIAMICGDDDQSEGKQGRVARSRMKSFAVLCAFALLGICLALGPKCRGKDPKMFEGLSKPEIAMICGDESLRDTVACGCCCCVVDRVGPAWEFGRCVIPVVKRERFQHEHLG